MPPVVVVRCRCQDRPDLLVVGVALPGEGCLDVAGIIATLEKNGYTGYFAIEMFNAELAAMPVAEASKLMYDSLVPFCDG